ncbi:alanine--tRNA ligase [Nitrospira sp.]|nr:alanine--tRNA ligase [Nitrospira sp.]
MGQTADELRQAFLRYFEGHGHRVVPSASLIPQADPTLLFTNAGMNQFKRVFLGEETRPYRRAASAQKCVRAGGKHNDLENVGYTARHHTFFEMLGNFSFGDYFKADAIRFGWEFLTREVGLARDRLWITVYKDDDEALDLWKRIGVAESRILRFGEKDNFWQMGDTGPCGPCSEIHVDQGPSVPGDDRPNGDGDRVIEIWNLVFMQYNQNERGERQPLPKPSIDTGMGLERLVAVAQGKHSNYDSDLFMPILGAIGERTNRQYGADVASDRSMRVIADHLRAISFLIADGILPSNEGRGYVLRRILRRAARHGRLLGVAEPFLHELTSAVVETMGRVYPELQTARGTIQEVTVGEEERFIATLDQGLPLLNDLVDQARSAGRTTLGGAEVFKLYDTYGFPTDLIAEACREHGITWDEPGFQRAIEEQRNRARKSAAFETEEANPMLAGLAARLPASQFIGYERLETDSVVQAILKGDRLVKEAREGEAIEVVLDVTPFYPEGGGQVGDRGVLMAPEGRIDVSETSRPVSSMIVQKGSVRSGVIREGDRVRAYVQVNTRLDAARNHTATHLVHAALRELLGPHVKQYGSLVAPNRLRFDFAHFKPLSTRDLESIETMVNEQIRLNEGVQTQVMGIQDAVAAGALAFFGDKYGDQVRVVSIDTFSKELCGGTHCRQTGEIGLFRIVSETGVAAGVRRIEAQTGVGALTTVKRLEADIRELSDILKVGPTELVGRAKKLAVQLKDKERELEALKLKMAAGTASDSRQNTIHGSHVHVQRTDGLDMNGMRALADRIREKHSSCIVALGGVTDGKVSLLVAVTKDLTGRIKAGDLIKPMAAEVGGTGGGRPELAQAGGKNPEGLDRALEKIFPLVESTLGQ